MRLYEEEEVLNVHLLVDASRSMDWGEPSKLQYARRLAATLGYIALNASNRLFVWPLSGSAASYGPAWGRGRAGPMLSFMEDVKPAQANTPVLAGMHAPPDLEQSLASFTSRTGGLVVLVSDLLSPSWEKALGRLAARSGDMVVLHTLSPQELRPTLGGDVRLIDRESGAAVSVTLNNDAIRLYGQRLDEWRRTVESFCAPAWRGLRADRHRHADRDTRLRRPATTRHRPVNLVTPLALALGVTLPIVVIFYLLKVRRHDEEVSSTFLWNDLIRDLAAHEPLQRLKTSLLLLLQLLALALITFTVARPFSEQIGQKPVQAVLLVDGSASMQAQDVQPSRFAKAVEAARATLAGLPENSMATAILVAAHPQVLVAATSDRRQVDRALADAHPSGAAADVREALLLARSLGGDPNARRIYLFTDGAFTLPTDLPDDLGSVSVVPVGQPNTGQPGGDDHLGAARPAGQPPSTALCPRGESV